ncbi:hypothetical protein, partial [Deinococcus cavernae]|uniref:hypothetical protein n=1 Tax=Deinococcus cavernae TaxID=2320857 RepID=UPI0011C23508
MVPVLPGRPRETIERPNLEAAASPYLCPTERAVRHPPLILPRGPEELIVYAHLAARLHAALSDERRGWYGRTLFGNVPTAPGSVSLLEPYLPHMLALNEHLEKEVKRYPVILSLDISGFYEHVQHRVLLDTVQRERLLGPLDQWLLAQMLGSFAARFGGQGTCRRVCRSPIRPERPP